MSPLAAIIILVVEIIGMIFVIKQGENKSMKHANKRKTYANNGDAYENGIQRTGICTMVEVEEVFEVEEGYTTGDHGKKR